MAALLDIYLKAETLETLLNTVKKKGDSGVALTISINDETNNYGQNVSSFVSQSKEDREAQKKKFYVGNGKVFWENGVIKKAVNTQQSQPSNTDEQDLPF